MKMIDLYSIEHEIPHVIPAPFCTSESEKQSAFVIDLGGKWNLKNTETGEEMLYPVPGDVSVLWRQGNRIMSYEYKTIVNIPKTEENSRFVLKFHGVNAFCDVYVNDIFVMHHENGLISWNIDITDKVKNLNSFVLRMKMDEKSDRVSCYSHGGIIFGAELLVLPERYIDRLYLTPVFTEDDSLCLLSADFSLVTSLSEGKKAVVYADIFGPDGENAGSLTQETAENNAELNNITFRIENPFLWDAEHPYLYRVDFRVYIDGELKETVSKKTGLRLIEKIGNRLYINRKEVKLRGACRHETTALYGRAVPKETVKQDVLLFKEANCNYLRTSHYPPCEYFLDLCDEMGIYVEDELALAFVARTLPYTQRDPALTERYLSMFKETFARDHSHPSVILWSLSNESFGGFNFDELNRYVHKVDPTRYTKFSYPMTIQEEHEMPDIWSIHYPMYDANLKKKRDNLSLGLLQGLDTPVLNDEYVHVCCYNREEIRRDPYARAFWGESIRLFWNNIWNTPGSLGGAIWAGIDEIDIYNGGKMQLEWGIIDAWRRKKPEFYMTRKAYSPINLIYQSYDAEKKELLLIIENRFNHTDLSEVKVLWSVNGKTGNFYLEKARPFETKKMYFTCEEWGSGPLELTFKDSFGNSVDEYIVGKQEESYIPETQMKEAMLGVSETETRITLSNGEYTAVISKETGLIEKISAGPETLITGGPILNIPYFHTGEWTMYDMSYTAGGNSVVITTKGGYKDSIDLTFTLEFKNDGSFDVAYRIDEIYKKLPKNLKMKAFVDDGGLDERGIAFIVDKAFDAVSWQRKTDVRNKELPTCFPKDHIGRIKGTAKRFLPEGIWAKKPENPWKDDMENYILFGRFDVSYKGSNDFRSTKENIERAYIYREDGETFVSVKPEKAEANVRLEVIDPENLKIRNYYSDVRYTGTWYPVKDKKESDDGHEMWSNEEGATFEIEFYGTGIVWYGPQDTFCGETAVYVDGEFKAEVSQRVAGCDFSSSSYGYSKKYHLPVYSVKGLPMGKHTLKGVVLHTKERESTEYYVILDYFRIIREKQEEEFRLIVNEEFSYPHIAWGNYHKKPILIEKGTEGLCELSVGRVKGKMREEMLKFTNDLN